MRKYDKPNIELELVRTEDILSASQPLSDRGPLDGWGSGAGEDW